MHKFPQKKTDYKMRWGSSQRPIKQRKPDCTYSLAFMIDSTASHTAMYGSMVVKFGKLGFTELL